MRIDFKKNSIELEFLIDRFYILDDYGAKLPNTLNFFINNEIDFSDAINDVSISLNIGRDNVSQLLFSAYIIFFEELSKEQQQEVSKLFQKYNININKFKEELIDDFRTFTIEKSVNIISSDDEVDDVVQMLSHHIKTFIENSDNELISAFDDKMMAQLTFNKDLAKKFLNALNSNKDIIGGKTISDWTLELSKYILDDYNSSIRPKESYLNTLKNLENKDRKTLSSIFDLYLRLKFFPESLKDIKDGEWFFIPCKKEIIEMSNVENISKEEILNYVKKDIRGILEREDAINDSLIDLSFDANTRKEIENAIYSNQEIISKKDFILNGESNIPNVSNWIKDYIANIGIDKYDDLNLSKFVTDSSNSRALDEQERNLLYKVLKLYLNIKFFPDVFKDAPEEKWHVIPIEEKITEKPVFKKVFTPELVIEKAPQAKDKQKSLEALLSSYKEMEVKIKGIAGNVSEFEIYKNNLDPLFLEMENDIKKKQKQRLMTELIFLCKNKLLPIFIKNNRNLIIEFKKYLVLKFSESTIESIIQKPDSVETVSLYLQFLFIEFGLTPKESGLFGMYLANIFKRNGQEKYFPIVYGDTNLERFIFRDVVEEAGVLKLK